MARLPVPERERAFVAYYNSTSPNDPYFVENRMRLAACVNYLMAHLQEFTIEHWLEQQGDSLWISPHFEAALYRVFAGVQIERIEQDFPISLVLDIAEEQQRLFSDHGNE